MAVTADLEDMAVTVATVVRMTNAPQTENNRARTGHKAIITEEKQSC